MTPPFASARRRLLAAAVTLSLAALAPLAYAGTVETIDLDWQDAGRQRAVPARLYWPAQARAEGPVPLVVFSHGIGGSRRGYSYLGRHFAAHGIASLHVQHVGSDTALWTGSPWTLVDRLQSAAQADEAVARARDLRFALDTLLASEYGSAIDPQQLVVAGHSYGANTALLAAGARVERANAPTDLHDPRYAAAIVISAPPFYGQADLRGVLRSVTIPTLHVTATGDTIQIPGYYSPADDRVAVFDAVGSARKMLVMFDGGTHSIFTDRTGTGGVELNAQVKSATRELATAFIARVFDGEAAAPFAAWSKRYQPIVARFVDGRGP
jgi:predicted dienelactone hydrolase